MSLNASDAVSSRQSLPVYQLDPVISLVFRSVITESRKPTVVSKGVLDYLIYIAICSGAVAPS